MDETVIGSEEAAVLQQFKSSLGRFTLGFCAIQTAATAWDLRVA